MRQRDERKSGSRGTGRGWSTPAASAHFSLEPDVLGGSLSLGLPAGGSVAWGRAGRVAVALGAL